MARSCRITAAALLLFAACRDDGEAQTYRYTRFAMGTVVEYTLEAPSHRTAQDAMLAAHEEVERVARLLWEEDSTSQIYRLNHTSGRVDVDRETFELLARTRTYHALSDGAFDATIKPVLDLYDFESDDPAPPSDAEIDRRLPLVGMQHLTPTPPSSVYKSDAGVALAVGGVAKGYAVDRAVAVLREHGIRNALVNAGGDLYCLGTHRGRPWRVGIRHPDDPNVLIDTLFVSDRAVATSGDYQRYFTYAGRRYHHLLDPRTGRPGRNARSATVLAETAEQADALSTALFIAGRGGLALIDSLPGVEGMVMDPEGGLASSRSYVRADAPPRR